MTPPAGHPIISPSDDRPIEGGVGLAVTAPVEAVPPSGPPGRGGDVSPFSSTTYSACPRYPDTTAAIRHCLGFAVQKTTGPRSVRARRAPAPRTSPPRKRGRRSVTRAGGRSGGLARVGSGVRSDIVHLTPPRRGLLVIVQDCRGHLDRARPPSVDLHRQARILSVGLVRACDDSCNNTLCASGGQGCRRGGTVEHWRLLRPSR